MNSTSLANELINIFWNGSIGTEARALEIKIKFDQLEKTFSLSLEAFIGFLYNS